MNNEEIKSFKGLNEELEGYPKNWIRAIKRVYEAYPKGVMPDGLCDPAYIINVISYEIGLSDGKGNFKGSGLNE